jgi:hypothetical protein
MGSFEDTLDTVTNGSKGDRLHRRNWAQGD